MRRHVGLWVLLSVAAFATDCTSRSASEGTKEPIPRPAAQAPLTASSTGSGRAEDIKAMNRLRAHGWQLLFDVASATPSFLESKDWVHESQVFLPPTAAPSDRKETLFGLPVEMFEPDEISTLAAAANRASSDEFGLYEATF